MYNAPINSGTEISFMIMAALCFAYNYIPRANDATTTLGDGALPVTMIIIVGWLRTALYWHRLISDKINMYVCIALPINDRYHIWRTVNK